MLKAIETHYNGYRFRSRLEARWAVFFDALGESYAYETEGFDLGARGWYLPDFRLSRRGTWVEIKPTFPPEAEWRKCGALATLGNVQVYLVYGDTFDDNVRVREFGGRSPFDGYDMPLSEWLQFCDPDTVSTALYEARRARFS